jgi:hypothetical protein
VKKSVIVGLVIVLAISIAAPSLAYAQEILPSPDMAAPLALVTFGLVGLLGGTVSYLRRHRAE